MVFRPVENMGDPNISLHLNTSRAHPADSFARSFEQEAGNAALDSAAANPNMEDAVLLGRVQAGDEAAMAMLFDRYSRLVYSVAMRVLRDEPAAEDVTQDIFMQVWRKPEIFAHNRGSLPAWLAVVARNRSIDRLRRKRGTESIEDVTLTANTNIAEEAERSSMMDKARAAIATLGPEQRKALELAFFDGLTHTEIAEMTGEPLGTIKTRIRSALLSVRKAMQA